MCLEFRLVLFRSAQKRSANSVIRENITVFDIKTKVEAIEKKKLLITVINKAGAGDAEFVSFCDKFSDLNKFSAIIYNANGKEIYKFKKSDLVRSEISQHVGSDNFRYFFSVPNNLQYPYTVCYEWEKKHKNGLCGYPGFFPVDSFNQSVISAIYTLRMPKDMPFALKNINKEADYEASEEKGFIARKYSFRDIHAIDHEHFMPSLQNISPWVLFKPIDFVFDKSEGSLKDWQHFGLWQNSLLKDCDKLPQELVDKLKQMTDSCSSDRSKVKVLYDYLAATTRYVSIQFGIGGFQPMKAAEVYKVGFGDCKALSYYMLSMLKAIDIPSVYTIIRSGGPKRLFPDFASVSQMNHAILQVPLQNDTLWLECTAPGSVPFGFIHSDIEGHDAILIKENGGELHTLPQYAPQDCKDNCTANIVINGDGTAVITGESKFSLSNYDGMCHIVRKPEKMQKESITRMIDLSNIQIQDYRITEDRSATPEINIYYNVNTPAYGNKTGERLFIPLNVFRNGYTRLETRRERKNDIRLSVSYIESDSITFKIPKNMYVESRPVPFAVETDFGSFVSFVVINDDKIIVSQKLSVKSGYHDKERYNDFVAFLKKITTEYNNKIVLNTKK